MRLRLIFALLATSICEAAEPIHYENEVLRLRITARTHEQMAGFYEARGFPPAMIEALRPACFFTVGIQNKGKDILWLDLGNWQFSAQGKAVPRIHRDEWRQRWQAMQIPLASQSTFRWTLLPEALDFRPAEREGGNITLQRVAGAISLDAVFHRGNDPAGLPLPVRIEGLECARGAP